MTYVIAECGQNHNGSLEMARALIDMCADPRPHGLGDAETVRPDAVKFTMRDLDAELTDEAWRAPYASMHAFGPTYGAHRQHLELEHDDLVLMHDYARKLGLGFVLTMCAPSCLAVLDWLTVDYIKVASRDLTNIPLLEAIAETDVPVIVSTGMANAEDLDRALEVVSDATILHCVSEYPAEFDHLNLRRIQTLTEAYPTNRIGYSDHSPGIMAPIAAIAYGAEVIEKHVTLDRTLRGSDHAGSLERDGLYRMMRDIRHLEVAAWCPDRNRQLTQAAQSKLERTCAAARPVWKGDEITEDKLVMLSPPGDGVLWRDRAQVLGVARQDIPQHATILPAWVEPIPVRP